MSMTQLLAPKAVLHWIDSRVMDHFEDREYILHFGRWCSGREAGRISSGSSCSFTSWVPTLLLFHFPTQVTLISLSTLQHQASTNSSTRTSKTAVFAGSMCSCWLLATARIANSCRGMSTSTTEDLGWVARPFSRCLQVTSSVMKTSSNCRLPSFQYH